MIQDGNATCKNTQKLNKNLIVIAGGIGLLGSLSANFIWWTSNNDLKFLVGLTSLIGFVLLFYSINKGYGRLDI